MLPVTVILVTCTIRVSKMFTQQTAVRYAHQTVIPTWVLVIKQAKKSTLQTRTSSFYKAFITICASSTVYGIRRLKWCIRNTLSLSKLHHNPTSPLFHPGWSVLTIDAYHEYKKQQETKQLIEH